MSAEEIGHANWVQRLHSKIKEGSVYFKEDIFNKEAIKTSLRYLNNQLSKAQMQEMSLMKALSIARDFESSLIEKKFFEVFEGDSAELKQILLNLAAATKDHYDRIQRAWNRNR